MSWLFKDPSSNHERNHVWLFKDPIVKVTYLNFNHAQSNSRKRPTKIKLPQMNFVLKKQITKIHVPISHFQSAKFGKNS